MLQVADGYGKGFNRAMVVATNTDVVLVIATVIK